MAAEPDATAPMAGAGSVVVKVADGDGGTGGMVLEGLGDGPSLATLLLGDDPTAAAEGARRSAASLGALHAASIGAAQAFTALRRQPDPGYDPRPQRLLLRGRAADTLIAGLPGLLVETRSTGAQVRRQRGAGRGRRHAGRAWAVPGPVERRPLPRQRTGGAGRVPVLRLRGRRLPPRPRRRRPLPAPVPQLLVLAPPAGGGRRRDGDGLPDGVGHRLPGRRRRQRWPESAGPAPTYPAFDGPPFDQDV